MSQSLPEVQMKGASDVPSTMSEIEAEFYIKAAYLAFLGREAESPYLQQWSRALAESGDLPGVLARFLNSDEYRRLPLADPGLGERLTADARGTGEVEAGRLGRAAGKVGRRLGYALDRDIRADRHAMLDQIMAQLRILFAWAAHNSTAKVTSRETIEVRSVPSVPIDVLIKDQRALSYRLLSLEESIARLRTDFDDGAARSGASAVQELRAQVDALAARDDLRQEQAAALLIEVSRLREQAAPVVRPRVQAIEDAAVHLSNGPFGNFLTIVPDLVGGVIERGDFWDPHLRPIFERYANRGKVAIDAGAYIGFHSVFLSKLFKTVHAFEPQIRCHRLLNANIELNRCGNVIAYNLALYDRAGTMTLAPAANQQVPLVITDQSINYEELGNAASLAFIPGDPVAGISVESIALDSLNLTDVAFIKIDAQGCDMRILSGAEQTIAASRPVITFELEEKLASLHGNQLSDFVSFFEGRDYVIQELIRMNSTQCDYVALPKELVTTP